MRIWQRAASPPARGRGLKHAPMPCNRVSRSVAPRAGAWIETSLSRDGAMPVHQSPPARGRGLKQSDSADIDRRTWSPPARGRGLKLIMQRMTQSTAVAPRAGAWIETSRLTSTMRHRMSPPARGRGLKHLRCWLHVT